MMLLILEVSESNLTMISTGVYHNIKPEVLLKTSFLENKRISSEITAGIGKNMKS